MNKIRTILFHPEHLNLLESREYESKIVNYEHLLQVAEAGSCGTVILDGRVLAITGFYPLGDGAFEVFVIPSQYVKLYPRPFLRHVRMYLDRIEKDCMPTMLRTDSKADDLTDHWMRFLGFTTDGNVVRFPHVDDDYRTWVRKAKKDG